MCPTNGTADNKLEAHKMAMSEFAQSISNPIRNVVEGIKMPETSEKKLILLAYGDPTLFGNLRCPGLMKKALIRCLDDDKNDGYFHSTGSPAARTAIAQHANSELGPLTKDDVVITCGAAGALDMVIRGIANEGDNLLIPRPGYPAYETHCKSGGIEPRFYRLLPEKQWESDLEEMQSLIDDRTKAIIITNPSNPCGSVYTKEHLLEILEVAERNNLPIITDEIYGDMTFGDNVFYPLASLSKNVPILTVSGLAKHFLVPGWRVGWLIVSDRNGVLKDVRQGFNNIAMLLLGTNSLAQSVIPDVLTPKPGSAEEQEVKDFKSHYYGVLEKNAKVTMDIVNAIPGMDVVTPQGSLYAMVKMNPSKFKDIEDDVEFTQKFLDEESVLVLPGQCFGMPNYFRTLTCPPKDTLDDAFSRMAAFCKRHAKE